MNFPKGKWVQLPKKQIQTINFPEELEFSGIYIIYLNYKYLYIGSSENVRSRIIAYLYRCRKGLHSLSDLQIKVRENKVRFEHLTLEAKLIFRLQPKENKRIPNGYSKKEQKEAIKQDIKRLTERLKPVLSGENRRLNHIDKDQGLNHGE